MSILNSILRRFSGQIFLIILRTFAVGEVQAAAHQASYFALLLELSSKMLLVFDLLEEPSFRCEACEVLESFIDVSRSQIDIPNICFCVCFFKQLNSKFIFISTFCKHRSPILPFWSCFTGDSVIGDDIQVPAILFELEDIESQFIILSKGFFAYYFIEKFISRGHH